MSEVVAINGSPQGEKGHTDMILRAFIEGMEGAGAHVQSFHTNRLTIKRCTGEMHCWYRKPGECHLKDDMQKLYPELRAAETLILATPVYIPLPSQMQKVLNRLCPLAEPFLEFREGRTRARVRQGVMIRRIVLISTGAWWEKENMDTVVRIASELARDFGVEFADPVLRPHAFLMKSKGELTEDGMAVLEATKRAGNELKKEGGMGKETLELISRPLISEEALRSRYNELIS
jgi:multimeric flavodoxin WrbA